MSKLVMVTCWSCGRKFQVSTEREQPTPVYKGLEPPAEESETVGEGDEVARVCPFCGKDNMVPR